MEPNPREGGRDGGAGDVEGLREPAGVVASAAVVSGSEHNHETSDDESSNDGDSSVPAYHHPDELFDENADDEDEAYVYKYMRGGTNEDVRVRRAAATSPGAAVRAREASGDSGASSSTAAAPMSTSQAEASGKASSSALEQAKMLKPRSSDAVLSCPCCFSIVCMDCQKHERYTNQWRAMFVMNIGVDWNRNLVYDEGRRELVEKAPRPSATLSGTGGGGGATRIPRDDPTDDEAEEFYYPVFCENCRTEVAALNMEDEVYHFYGCIASA